MTTAPLDPNLVSILVPCAGGLATTRLCLSRLLRHSRPPFEIIALDLNTIDGTADYLTGLADAASVRVVSVQPDASGSLHSAVAAALTQAQGTFLAWVNNDVLVPELWLLQLLGMLQPRPQIGMVGPMSNRAPEAQQVPDIDYLLRQPHFTDAPPATLDTQPFDHFATTFRETHKGQFAEVDRLAGFCFVTRRSVLAQVPLLDPKAPDAFDATRFCHALRGAGFRLVCCKDLFVHHFGAHLLDAPA